MLCETKTGCTSNIQIYRAQGKKLNDTIMSLLENDVGVHYHVYQDNFYNSVNLAEKLMKCNIRLCGTMRHSKRLGERDKRAEAGTFVRQVSGIPRSRKDKAY